MMKRRLVQSTVVFVLLCSVFLAARACAMSSANYRLDWLTSLSGSGGGPVASSSYKANFTVGQTVIGTAASANYRVGLGYWYGMDLSPLYLPVILR